MDVLELSESALPLGLHSDLARRLVRVNVELGGGSFNKGDRGNEPPKGAEGSLDSTRGDSDRPCELGDEELALWFAADAAYTFQVSLLEPEAQASRRIRLLDQGPVFVLALKLLVIL